MGVLKHSKRDLVFVKTFKVSDDINDDEKFSIAPVVTKYFHNSGNKFIFKLPKIYSETFSLHEYNLSFDSRC